MLEPRLFIGIRVVFMSQRGFARQRRRPLKVAFLLISLVSASKEGRLSSAVLGVVLAKRSVPKTADVT